MSTDNSAPVTPATLDLRFKATEEQRIIMVAPEVFQEFQTRLGKAPEPNVALRKTMQTRVPWDQKK